ncbi:MAG: alkaline phosphatase family protein [Terriglobales bacterium]|jgi:phospholipase C
MKLTFKYWTLLIVGLMATAACAQIPYPNPINHVIVIDQENRTVDNLLGSNSPTNAFYLPGLVFSTTGQAYKIVKKKKTVFTVSAVSIPLASKLGSGDSVDADDYDPNHSHTAWGKACDAPVITDPSNDCAMDGFNHVTIGCDKGATGCPGPAYPTYAYVQYKDVAPYFQIASQYGYANYFFQTNQGPSFPSHQFTFGGTSQPGDGPEPTWFVSENMNGGGNNGCIAGAASTVALVNPATQDEKTKIFPCFDRDTMADVFASVTPQITWTYYTPGQGSLWSAPDAIEAICTVSGGKCTGPYWTKGAANGYIDVNPSDVLTDITGCSLKQVSWVIPTALESDHAGSTDGSGPSWVASIVNAIGNQAACPDGEVYWDNTVILITWDDWGGWYETVTPPALPAAAPAPTSSYAYGFRVPFFVVSAYTPAGTVNNNSAGLDFGTMLKFIEEIFDLGNISPGDYADFWSNGDLGEFFQFSSPPRSFQSIAAPLKADFFLNPNRPIDPPDND